MKKIFNQNLDMTCKVRLHILASLPRRNTRNHAIRGFAFAHPRLSTVAAFAAKNFDDINSIKISFAANAATVDSHG